MVVLQLPDRHMISIQYKAGWPQEFERLGGELKYRLGHLAKGIHHIGSTSVPGLAAKDVIDIQVTVDMFSPEIKELLAEIGYSQLAHITYDHKPAGMEHLPDAQCYKWFFQKTEPDTNLHIRKVGTYNQRFPLLCRDYLRHNTAAAKAYEEVKRNLAKHFPHDMAAYYDVKDPVFDVLMAGAEIWSAVEDWQPNSSDIPF